METFIAMLIIRQLLDHHRQIADIEEFSLRSNAGIIRSHAVLQSFVVRIVEGVDVYGQSPSVLRYRMGM